MSAKDPTLLERPADRRSFLKWSGGAMLATAVLAEACKRPEDLNPNSDNRAAAGDTIVLSGDDYGILNYAYALEQLEAAFYIRVVADPAFSSIMSAEEQAMFTDIRDHEICHREFFKLALGTHAIPALTPNFSSIQFNSRRSVLRAARAFEDLGVSAYNGAGPGIQDPAYLAIAGKIVSVEARHAAYIREIYGDSTFVENDVVHQNYNLNYTLLGRAPISSKAPTAAQLGYDAANTSIEISRTPVQVISMAQVYIVETIDASQVPTA